MFSIPDYPADREAKKSRERDGKKEGSREKKKRWRSRDRHILVYLDRLIS